ncbi:MAG: hypothetical protein Q8M26_06985 [Pseudolabrys sp.]|nr:hypothetical protein [Pseudolabrys sp.]
MAAPPRPDALAPAPVTPKPASRRRIHLTPALLEDIRRRYEETDDTMVAIAADYRMSDTTLRRLVREHRWARRQPVPRELPKAASLQSVAEALDQQRLTPGPSSADPDIFDNLVVAAGAMLAALTAWQRRLPATPAGLSGEGEASARTIDDLTRTFAQIRRRRGVPSGPVRTTADVPFDEDDRYANIDAFRDEIARRIEAFVESESRAEDRGDGPAPDVGG